MIDGLGWFHEADYRRSWLLLDDVEYVLPSRIQGSLTYPPGLEERSEVTVGRPSAPAGAIVQEARADCDDPEFLEIVRRIPERDAAYSELIVWSDAEARAALGTDAPPGAPLAVSYLLNKLLWRARESGAAPLVGQPYASDLVVWKIGRIVSELPWKRQESGHRFGYAAFAAGLSLDFVGDEDLASADIERLVAFKTANRPLVERAQQAVVEAVRRFDGLPSSGAFSTELTRLRQDALNERSRLEELARSAWLDTGLGLAKRAAAAAAKSSVGGMLVLSVLQNPLAAVAAAGGIVAVEAVDALTKRASAPAPKMTFLFKVGRLLAR